MKFLLITNNDFDGVGQRTISLNNELKSLGYECKTLVFYKSLNKEYVIKIKRSIFLKYYFFLLNFLKKDFNRLFSFNFSTIKYESIKNYVKEADVIIIYSLAKFLSPDILKKIFLEKKIVYFRPLDMEFATGGCHVNFTPNASEKKTCLAFTRDCRNCPQLNFLNFNDIPNKILLAKKKIIEKYKPKIFTVNSFKKRIYDKSIIHKKVKTKKLFLSANKNRIKYLSKKNARKKLNFKDKEKIILFGSFNLDSKSKGGEQLKNILKKVIFELNKGNLKKYKYSKMILVTFGNKTSFKVNLPGLVWKHMGLVNSDEKLNLLYRASDVLVCPSINDSGPHIVTEALLNDLPIVAFNLGVAQDAIINGVNGYIIPCFNEKKFSKGILNVLFKKKTKNKTKLRKIKNLFKPMQEATEIIKYAKKDLKQSVNLSNY